MSELNKTGKYVEIGNFTLKALNASINKIKLPVKACPSSTPVFNGSNCSSCPNGTYYVLKNFTCYTALNVSNILELNKTGKYVEIGNFTLKVLNASISSSKAPCQGLPLLDSSLQRKCLHGPAPIKLTTS